LAVVPVLHIITRLIVGGAQENTILTADLLQNDPRYEGRYTVDLISGAQSGPEGSLISEVQQRGIPLTIVPQLTRQISPLNDMRTVWKLASIMRARRYAIVHTHSSKAGILGRTAARLAKTRVILHSVHGWSFHDHMSPWLKRFYTTLEKWAATFSEALMVVSQSDIHKGIKAGIGRKEQYQLIRSAIPLEEFDPAKFNRAAMRRALGIPLDAPVLGTVGRFSTQKNPLDWVRVARQVQQVLPECCFLLVGDGPLRSKVEFALQEAGIFDRTVLTGIRRDVAQMLAAMDVFLLTSLWEGLPRVIPQALSMCKPVVANRVDGVSEAIQNGKSGVLISTGDLAGMASSCLELLSDAQRREEMGQAGREFVKHEFDLYRMLSQIDHLYQSLL
jgi:glycosyltransferase involved in cell wall biosynthesis